MSGDDAYQKFQCNGDFWQQYHINVLYVDSGNLLLGVARCLAFMMFIGFQYYNKVLLNRKEQNNVNVIRGLILPSYLPFIYFYTLFSLLTGLIDLVNQATNPRPEDFDFWIFPIEIGITHWFLEGLAIFLMRYGAGFSAIRRSFRYSFLWGLFTAFWFFIIFTIFDSRWNTDRERDENKIFGLFISYEIVLFIFYTAYALIPPSHLYHRPALTFYAKFSSVSTAIVIFFAIMYHCKVYEIICPGSIVAFIFAAFLQPLAIYKTLQIDSQYWQGLSPEPGNPLTEVWDHLGIETASSMAENLETFGRMNRKLPIIHFGLMHFDQDLKFVAGGFSRVYFGSLQQERVAFKILFAMELDPKDVEEFYREAAVLHKLKHPNVVRCLGVCVMPPALTIVLELCKNGSLFDFLYKPVTTAVKRQSITSMIRTSIIGTRNSLMGGSPTEIEMMTPGTMSVRPSEAQPTGLPPRTMSDDAGDDEYGHNGANAETVNPINRKASGRPYSAPVNGALGGLILSEPPSARPSCASVRPSAMVNDLESGGSPDGSGGGSGAPGLLQKQRSGRTLAAIMQAPFRANDTTKADPDASLTPRASFNNSRAPLGQSTSFNRRLAMMRDAVCGIAFLHEQGYMHCDIKSLNFLVSEDYVLKLADMGEARPIKGPPKRNTPPIPARNWAPPEVLVEGAKAEVYTVNSDIYGLCIVLAEIILAELPFGESPNLVSTAKWHSMLTVDNLRPKLPEQLPSPLRAIIEQGWSTDPAVRPTADAILKVIDEFVVDDRPSNMSVEEDL